MTEILAALKWTLQITVEGMSLWKHWGTHIDVMFPDDQLGVSWKHHFVTLHPEEDDPTPFGAQRVGVPLHGVTLDFSGLTTVRVAKPTQAPFGMLPMTLEPGSRATKKNAVLEGDGLVAGLRLPPGSVSSLGHEKGPFTYGSDEALRLGYGVRWIGTGFGPQNAVPRLITYGRAASTELHLFSDDTPCADRALTIRNLSFEDRTTQGGMRYGDELTEVAYQGHIVREDKQPLTEVPVYHGNPPGVPSVRARPQRPCPAGWAI